MIDCGYIVVNYSKGKHKPTMNFAEPLGLTGTSWQNICTNKFYIALLGLVLISGIRKMIATSGAGPL